MLIYKRITSRKAKCLNENDCQAMKCYGMASVRDTGAVAFVECQTWADVRKAQAQEREIIGITAIAVIVPFRALNIHVEAENTGVNVSGAVWIRINPTTNFREYVLRHTESELTYEQLILEFDNKSEPNLEPFLRGVVNRENLVQLRKFGADAADVTDLADTLPDWCEVTKVLLAVDGTEVASRYAREVEEAIKKQNTHSERPDKPGLFVEVLKKSETFFGKLLHGIDVLLSLTKKYSRSISLLLLIMVIGVFGREYVFSLLGGEAPYAVPCEVVFEGDTNAASLEKYLLKDYLTAQFQTGQFHGNKVNSFDFGTTYRLSDSGFLWRQSDVQKLIDWINNYGPIKSRILQASLDDQRRTGLHKLLKIGKNQVRCTLRLTPVQTAEYTLKLEQHDDSHQVAKLLQSMFQLGEAQEYKLQLFPAQVQHLRERLETDDRLQALGLLWSEEKGTQVIHLYLTNVPSKHRLNVANIVAFPELTAQVEQAVPASRQPVSFRHEVHQDVFLTGKELNDLASRFDNSDLVCCKPQQQPDGTLLVIFDVSKNFQEKFGIDYTWSANPSSIQEWWQTEPAQYNRVKNAWLEHWHRLMKLQVPEELSQETGRTLTADLEELRKGLDLSVREVENFCVQLLYYSRGDDDGVAGIVKEMRELVPLNWDAKITQTKEAIRHAVRVGDLRAHIRAAAAKLQEAQQILQAANVEEAENAEGDLEDLKRQAAKMAEAEADCLNDFTGDYPAERQSQQEIVSSWRVMLENIATAQMNHAIEGKLNAWRVHAQTARTALQEVQAELESQLVQDDALEALKKTASEMHVREENYLSSLDNRFVWRGNSIEIPDRMFAPVRKSQEDLAADWKELHEKICKLITEKLASEFKANLADYHHAVAELAKVNETISAIREAVRQKLEDVQGLDALDRQKNRAMLKQFVENMRNAINDEEARTQWLDTLEYFQSNWNANEYSRKLGQVFFYQHPELATLAPTGETPSHADWMKIAQMLQDDLKRRIPSMLTEILK